MSQRAHTKSKIKDFKAQQQSLFHLQNKKAVDGELSDTLVRSARRSGQLSLNGRGLGSVPDRVWMINELVLEENKDVDFDKSYSDSWWTTEPLKSLDLSSNAIKEISPKIKMLPQLINLKLHDNAIGSLPPEIGELCNLATLTLSHNKLVKLPVQFYKLSELRVLSISHNLLERIEPSFGDLVMLNRLDLSNNKLMSLPAGMGFLIRLVDLNLSHNQLMELPPDIVNLRDLKKMDITHNNLKFLPPMGELRRLVILEANHNDIAELPQFEGCTAMKEVYLANNYIKEITEEFCEQMQHLNVLNLRDNKLEVLPENITLLQNLKRLDITNNNLNKLPKNLGLMSQLQSLSMEGNRLKSMRQDILAGGTTRMLKHLRDLSTEDPGESECNKGPDWPDKYTMKKLQSLQLVGKEVTTVPEDLFKTAAEAEVHIVDLAKNKLTVIPQGIVQLSETLAQLILTSNCLTELPAEIALCTHLQYMELSKNAISDLPLDFGGLKSMRELVISSNKFTKIPKCVYDMESLEILLASENQISEVNVSSDALAKVKRLAVLDLRNNSISSVPPELGNFTQLRSLELMGNCFRQPRHAILEKGTASILCYLRDRIPKV